MDYIIRSTGETVELRFVLVDVTQTANRMASLHALHGEPLRMSAESIAGGFIIASTMKYVGVLQLDFHFKKSSIFIQTDVTSMGYVRSRTVFDPKQNSNDNLETMTVVKRNEKGKKIQESIVEISSLRLENTFNQYQSKSEQFRSMCRIECQWENNEQKKLKHCIGVLVEAFPKASTAFFEERKTLFKEINFFSDLNHPFSLKRLLKMVADPHVFQIHREIPVKIYCPCSKERFLKSLASLSSGELKEFTENQKSLETECEFCHEKYQVTSQDLEILCL